MAVTRRRDRTPEDHDRIGTVALGRSDARVWRGGTQFGALTRTLDEHQTILGALRRRDPRTGRDQSTVQIAGVQKWLRATPDEEIPDSDDEPTE